MDATVIFGGPGCGKTHRLVDVVRRELDAGVPPDRIAFVSFTRSAAEEARDRARRDLRLSESAFPWFRTVHSTCFRSLGLRRDEVMDRDGWREFARFVNEEIRFARRPEDPFDGEPGDAMVATISYAEARRIDLEAAWHEARPPVDWPRLRRFAAALDEYKRSCGLVTFDDMISEFLRVGARVPVEVAIVDEAQDLTTSQWAVVDAAFAGADRLYVAGDDDQSIYRWAGADPSRLASIAGAREILPTSRRLPRAVHRLATRIVERVSDRVRKKFAPRDAEGEVRELADPSEVDLRSGTWLMLARCVRHLRSLEEIAESQGVVYSSRGRSSVRAKEVRAIRAWTTVVGGRKVRGSDAALIRGGDFDEDEWYGAEDLGMVGAPPWHEGLRTLHAERREYYQRCLRNGEDLGEPPRVRIDTIHSTKGAEADDVLLLPDVTARVARAMFEDPDPEHRAFYVGATRARERLHLPRPASSRRYEI